MMIYHFRIQNKEFIAANIRNIMFSNMRTGNKYTYTRIIMINYYFWCSDCVIRVIYSSVYRVFSQVKYEFRNE